MTDHRTQNLSLILGLIRSGAAVTRPELARQTGLGRTVITQRVEQGLRCGLLSEGEQAPSTGGRPSRVLRIASGRGVVLGAVFGASHLQVAVSELDGRVRAEKRVTWDVEKGPEASLGTLVGLSAELLDEPLRERVWGVCVGLPGPVDFARGTPVRPPIMAGWHGFPVRTRLEAHYGAPAWVDNDVNAMALGAWTHSPGAAGDDVLLLKASTGIGLGLISRGRLHRGARGAAGDFGHTIVAEESRHRCRCGKFGCLEALAGGWALARDARAAALAGRSALLARRMDRSPAPLTVADVVAACQAGDRASIDLVVRAGELIGAQLATVVSVFNPSTVFLSGLLPRTGELFRAPLAEAVTRRSLPLATDELVIAETRLGGLEGVLGAAHQAVDELLRPGMLDRWLPEGTPRGLSLPIGG